MTHGTSFSDIFGGYAFGELLALGIILFQIGIYVFYSYTQYILSKKMEIEYSWMAWIPVLSTFNLVKIAGKSYWWVLWIILGYIAFIVPGIILTIIMLHGISKRTGHGGWWTFGLIFLWFILFPITAFTYSPTEKNELDPTTLPA